MRCVRICPRTRGLRTPEGLTNSELGSILAVAVVDWLFPGLCVGSRREYITQPSSRCPHGIALPGFLGNEAQKRRFVIRERIALPSGLGFRQKVARTPT